MRGIWIWGLGEIWRRLEEIWRLGDIWRVLHRLWAGWRSLVTAWRMSVEAWTEGRIPESVWKERRIQEEEEEEAAGSRGTVDQVESIS